MGGGLFIYRKREIRRLGELMPRARYCMTLQRNFFTDKPVMYRHLTVCIYKEFEVGELDYTYNVCSNSRLETEISVICCGGFRNSSVGIPEPKRSPSAIEFLGSVYCFDAPSHIYTLDHIINFIVMKFNIHSRFQTNVSVSIILYF